MLESSNGSGGVRLESAGMFGVVGFSSLSLHVLLLQTGKKE